MPPRRKRRKPLRARRRVHVSVSAEAYAWIKAAAEARNMSVRQLVETACEGGSGGD